MIYLVKHPNFKYIVKNRKPKRTSGYFEPTYYFVIKNDEGLTFENGFDRFVSEANLGYV
jgi:hypothetical protein